MNSKSPSLTSSENIAPDEIMPMSDAIDAPSPRARSDSSMGRAKGSPTMTAMLVRVASIVSKSSSPLKRREASSTSVPPSARHSIELNRPVPCMSGQAGRMVADGPPCATSSAASRRVASRS